MRYGRSLVRLSLVLLRFKREWLCVAVTDHLQLGLLIGARLLLRVVVAGVIVAGWGGWHLNCHVLGDLKELEGFGELERR